MSNRADMQDQNHAASRARNEDPEYGPLGPGHAPAKDPLKGLNGVMAGVLVMQSITFFLVLTVISRIDNGAYWTTGRWVFVTVISLVLFLLGFMMRFPWAHKLNVAVQAVALVGACFVHVSMVAVAVMFVGVWAYVYYLRSMLIARMKRGLLVTQHT